MLSAIDVYARACNHINLCTRYITIVYLCAWVGKSRESHGKSMASMQPGMVAHYSEDNINDTAFN